MRGGLGFRDMELFNQAVIEKKVWRVLRNPSSLVAQVLKQCYFPNGQIFDATQDLVHLTFGEAYYREFSGNIFIS